MNLEDHLGDIIRKARQAANVSNTTAAKAGGLSESELSVCEDTCRSVKGMNLSALAAVAGLDGQKLETIAAGWLPQSRDLSLWRELRVITTTRQDITVNCYLVWDEVSREGALFDTGWDAAPGLNLICASAVQTRHFLLTHSHEDHIAATGTIR